MGSQHTPLATLFLLGVLVISGLGENNWEDRELPAKLSGSHSPCQGQLEVLKGGEWSTVDSHSWGYHSPHQERLNWASKLCRRLNCGVALSLGHFRAFGGPRRQLTCWGYVGSFANCSNISSAHMEPLGLICLEPPKIPLPTIPPPTTTTAPMAPPRLRLVSAGGALRCAGVLEVYAGGVGGSVLWEARDSTRGLEQHICQSLRCGSFMKHLPDEAARMEEQRLSWALPMRWEMANSSCAFPEQCFLRAQPRPGHLPLALLCSGFQPKVQSRLVGGSGPCAGSVEVRQDGQWAALCSSNVAKSRAHWEEACREQGCGQLSSYRVLDASERTQGQLCPQEKLSECHQLQEESRRCKRVFITCQDPNAPGLGAGSVTSIILALVLLAVLLAMCGPLAYKKLVKKFRQKKQRQWIGPTEMSQNMSFHRNHTATVRSPAENPTATHVENEYSQPPSSAHSTYPALERALHRVSAQPDNSSDSDYDLQVTQRL